MSFGWINSLIPLRVSQERSAEYYGMGRIPGKSLIRKGKFSMKFNYPRYPVADAREYLRGAEPQKSLYIKPESAVEPEKRSDEAVFLNPFGTAFDIVK